MRALNKTEYVVNMKNINKSYGKGDNKVLALKDVSVQVKRGEFVAILGPSGSGKTTLMNIIGLMDSFDCGEYLLDDVDISKTNERQYSKLRRDKIGFVFQKYNLINKYTALYNVMLPSLLQGKSYKQAKNEATKMISKVGLLDRGHHKPHELSGGQIQRTAIARALMGNSSLILADEPTGALDQKTGLDIMEYLKALNQEGKSIIMITHDINIAKQAGRIIRVEDGKIVDNSDL